MCENQGVKCDKGAPVEDKIKQRKVASAVPERVCAWRGYWKVEAWRMQREEGRGYAGRFMMVWQGCRRSETGTAGRNEDGMRME